VREVDPEQIDLPFLEALDRSLIEGGRSQGTKHVGESFADSHSVMSLKKLGDAFCDAVLVR